MKMFLFPKLAITSIIKNKKLYLPYIISCVGSILMFCVIQNLSYSSALAKTKGGSEAQLILTLGKLVIAIFSVLFLFYTNSFLNKKRYKEFGLYSLLGMDKKSIGKVVFWESLFISITGLVLGVILGTILTKIAELALINAIKGEIDYSIPFSFDGLKITVLIYGSIFLLLMLKSLINVFKLKPLELFKSSNYGEKPPKSNIIFGIIGLVLIGVAYYIAISIKSPLTAIITFFFAVVMVIVGTYMLFVSGSVTLCRLLKKDKKYYYKKQHFVSVSSMAYRMKRNGEGLATICVLCTMVLVLVSSTSSLYFGANDALKHQHPENSSIALYLWDYDNLTDERIKPIRQTYEDVFKENNYEPEDLIEYRYSMIAGNLEDKTIIPEVDLGTETLSINYDQLRYVLFLNLDDYNRIQNANYTLGNNETLLYTIGCEYDYDELNIKNLKLNVKDRINECFEIAYVNSVPMPSFICVINGFEELKSLQKEFGDEASFYLNQVYYYGYNSSLSDEETNRIHLEQLKAIKNIDYVLCDADGTVNYDGGTLASRKDNFFTTIGGLFFLGIILSILFISAAVIIIYYKQISEGYEDQDKFTIMRNVGMSKKDIKKSINSQILTVFFAPLIVAGIHLCFAFPFIWKMLQIFGLSNITYVIMVSIIAFVIFGIFYAIIYKVTAKSYYQIVS